mgnify:CR=1 FL=1
MTRLLTRVGAGLRRFGRDQSGTAAVNFVLMFPVVFGVFMLTMDSGFATIRASLLDRALDVTARSIRNGTIASPTLASIRTDLCSQLTSFPDCATTLKVQIVAVSRSTFALPGVTSCADLGAAIVPVRAFVAGQQNGIAVLRACLQTTSLTPVALLPGRPGSYGIHAETVIAGSAT